MRLERVMSMGLAEVAGRGRQELWKGLERMELLGARAGQHHAVDRAAQRAALERFRNNVSRRFFAGAVRADTPALIAERLPAERSRILAEANALLAGRFDLLGYRGLSFGTPVDWHLDPVNRRRAPLVHWTRLDPLDAEAVGDSKVIWELNRHQWLVRLAQAYQLTGDERYARHVAASVESWLATNPVGHGINWASSLEAALRIIAWSWTLVLLRESPALSPALFAAMVESVRAQATRVERYLSYYFSPNTHLTGEALGLFHAGVLFPELGRARRWRELGRRILVEECARQVLEDGAHFERATCYQRYTAEIYLHFALLAGRSGSSAPGVSDRLDQLLDFLLAIRAPGGAMPQIGDADGGWLLPLSARRADDLAGLFGAAAATSGRADLAWASPDLAPEVVWLLGRPGVATFETLRPAPPARGPSRVFPEGGYAVMQSAWDAQAHQLVLDVGPLGCPVSAGHGHADLLSVQCAAFGEPYLVDPGTYCYTADLAWRDFFRGASAHSTVTVDGRDQATPRGPFGWRERPGAILRRWRADGALQIADAEHGAYGSLDDPVGHRRRVLWVAPRYWVVVDDLAGAAEHRVALRWQFAPLDVALEAPWARARRPSGRGLLVRSFAAVALTTRIACGSHAPMEGWVSAEYGQRTAAPMLISEVAAPLPLRIATLLYPLADGDAAPPPAAGIVDAAGHLVAIALHDGRELVRFGEPEGEELSC